MNGNNFDNSSARAVSNYSTIQLSENHESDSVMVTPVIKKTPIPWDQMVILIFVRLSDPIAFTMLLPFVYQFVKNSGVAKTSGEIGLYVGIMASSFSFAQCLTSIYWGTLSDRIGRKPVLISGLSGTLITTLAFGFTNNFYIALTFRTLAGLLNGNVSITKSVVAELSDSTNRVEMFALLPLCGNVGSIVGPLIGGIFYAPTDNFFGIFKKFEIFTTFPHLFPYLIVSFINLTGLILAISHFKETHFPENDDFTNFGSIKNTDNLDTPLVSQLSKSRSNTERTLFGHLSPNLKILSLSQSSSAASSSCSISSQKPLLIHGSRFDDLENTAMTNRISIAEDTPLLKPAQAVNQQTFKEKFSSTMKKVLATNITFTLAKSMSDSFFAVWSASDLSLGGLEFSPHDISVAIGFSGLIVFHAQLVSYPKFTNKYGILRCYQAGLLVVAPAILLMPLVSLFASLSLSQGSVIFSSLLLDQMQSVYRVLMWTTLQLLLAMRVYGSVYCFSSVNLMITNSTLSSSDLGLMNGIQQVVASFTRVIGPLLVGVLWKYSSESTWVYPFNKFFIWNVVGLLVVYTSYKSYEIPEAVDDNIIDKK